jgi:hypothetical protein
MFHARVLNMAFIYLAICSCLSGCGGGGDKGPVTKANFDKIKADGSENLAAVETIMSSKGTELPKEAWKKYGIDSGSIPFRKAKLLKEDDNKHTAIADDNGSEAKVFRWGDDNKYIYVAVLEDKVVLKSMKEK